VHFGEFRVLPWFLPAVAISVAVGLVVNGRVARTLGIRRAVALTLVLSLGAILSATLTPLRGALAFGTIGTGTCDLSRMGLAPLRELFAVNDVSLNVLLFVPLGLSIAFIPRSRLKVIVLIASIGLPFAIEGTQLLVPALDRACESADVVDNLTGLTVGLVFGVVAGRFLGVVSHRSR